MRKEIEFSATAVRIVRRANLLAPLNPGGLLQNIPRYDRTTRTAWTERMRAVGRRVSQWNTRDANNKQQGNCPGYDSDFTHRQISGDADQRTACASAGHIELIVVENLPARGVKPRRYSGRLNSALDRIEGRRVVAAYQARTARILASPMARAATIIYSLRRAILRGFASSPFGNVNESTPFTSFASTLSVLAAAGRLMRCAKRP